MSNLGAVMADERERTLEMVQRRANFVPEGLRPDGFGEKMGWYNAAPSWMIAERQYDTKPFGADIGVDPVMELILRRLLLGGSINSPAEKPKQPKKPVENNYNVNEYSNRFAEAGDIERNF